MCLGVYVFVCMFVCVRALYMNVQVYVHVPLWWQMCAFGGHQSVDTWCPLSLSNLFLRLDLSLNLELTPLAWQTGH